MTIAGFGVSLVLAACGSSGPPQNVSEPRGNFPVAVDRASFPAVQTLSGHTQMRIAVRNVGHKTIPDIAVTICNNTCAYPASVAQGADQQFFSQIINVKPLPNSNRPVWVVERAPDLTCAYSCRNGGQGGAVTAYANTWALGPLAPGKTVQFVWKVSAVVPGRYVLGWTVAAGLNGKARAVLSDGSQPHGTFAVTVNSAPQQSYVNNSGQIVVGKGQ